MDVITVSEWSMLCIIFQIFIVGLIVVYVMKRVERKIDHLVDAVELLTVWAEQSSEDVSLLMKGVLRTGEKSR